MNDTPTNTLPKSFAEAVERAALAQVLSKPERMKQHRINIRAAALHGGIDDVKRYKAEYPESSIIQVQSNPLAYIPKPKGYSTYLTGLAERWLGNSMARANTNAEDVRALNERFETSYPPGKHFSEPLSKARRAAIKSVFSRQGMPFDVKAIKTMSEVKAAARAARAQIESERRLGCVGTISGDTLVMGRQPFTITRNGERECIRVMIGGTRQRVYLDQIEWLADLLRVGGDDPLNTTTERSMRDVAYPVAPADLPAPAPLEISELASAETSDADPLMLDWELNHSTT